ncbi:flavin reductase family protein [Rhizobium sophorae]|uniref:Flavin reductase family protein n=1 Tax=Rhizobium sophorae TaxID=1535242 RepID=A0A7Y3S997_9HYPH|nr:flavin reductase family protein [Rhizobium sophorae]MBX4862488.1 flavin reductase family protein [Rhizobium bangladeshense]NNU39300.1 flavin reductase family protein [Rhizobium sophorae]
MGPVIDVRSFRQALGQFPTGVCVVTSVIGTEKLGVTISSFNSLSLDPPLILFSIDRRAASLSLWMQAECYAINVLSENQADLSSRFSRPLTNKWEGFACETKVGHGVIIPGVAAVFHCAPWAAHDGGDHLLFIGRVTSFQSFCDRRPLVFSQGRYAALESGSHNEVSWPLAIHY